MEKSSSLQEELERKKREIHEIKTKALHELYEEIERHKQALAEIRESRAAIRELSKTVNDEAVSPYQLVIYFLEAGLTTLSELSEASGLKANSVFQFLKTMEGNGRIERVLDKGQRRNARYLLPDKSRSRRNS